MSQKKYKNSAEKKAAYRARVAAREPAIDRGTPEMVFQRLRAVNGGDPTLATAPLDVLLARGLITAEQNQAGWAYAELYRRIYGTVFGPCGQYSDMVAAGSLVSAYVDDIERDRGLIGAYYSMDAALKSAGNKARRAVRTVAIEWGRALDLNDLRLGLKGLTAGRE